jgi:hypothetical protein
MKKLSDIKQPDYGKPVGVGRPVRILLGAIIMVAAVFFGLLGLYIIRTGLSHVPLKHGDVIAGVIFSVFGVAFSYVAFRLMVVANNAPLLGRTASLVAAVFLVGTALFVLAHSLFVGDIHDARAEIVMLLAGVWLWRTAWKRGKHEP